MQKGNSMSNAITDIIDKKRIEIGRVIHRCNTLCDDVNMIFFLPSKTYASNYRYTYANPATILAFLFVTLNKESANKLQMDRIVESPKQNDRSEYTVNLLILLFRFFNMII